MRHHRPQRPARRRHGHLAPAMVAGAVLLLSAGPVRAQNAHGAIAFVHITQDQAVAYGFAWDYSTKEEAQDAAVNSCISASGGSGCTVLAWFQNGCGALAMDQYGTHQGKTARTLEQAEARALATCEAAGGVGCAVVGSQCVSPGGAPNTWSGSESVLEAPEEVSGPIAGEVAADRERPTAVAPRDEELTREERIQVQQGLAALGFEVGPADGMFGLRIRSAIWEWQLAKGLEPTGYLSRDEAEVIAAAGVEASRETAAPDSQGNQVLYFMPEGPKCAELGSYLSERDTACWEEIQSQPGCHIWNDHYHSDRTADWTGECAGYTAHGTGDYSLSAGSEHDRESGTGSVVYGKLNGHWVWSYADGGGSEGSYVDGELNGHWVYRWADGGGSEGPYVDGKLNGHWVIRFADGDVLEGPYVDGERHGHWVIRFTSFVEEGPYVDGKQHGHWVIRFADGDVSEGPYVDGKKHGRWVNRWADGSVTEYEWRNGSLVETLR